MDFVIPEDLKQIQMLVRRFVREELQPIENMVEEQGDFPTEMRKRLFKRAVDLGIRNMGVPQKFGGGGVGLLGLVLAGEEMGWASEAVTYGMLGGGGDGLEVATEEQRKKYFYPSLRGDKESCTGWTEPNAGGDAAGIQTRAVKQGKGWVLNGTKHFITAADKCDFAVVGAITDPQKPKTERFTQFIVEFGTPGFIRSVYQPMMGRHGLRSFELVLQDCFVPDENVLGQVGGALRRQLSTFGGGRLLMGGKFVGTAERALEMAKNYAKKRVTFGQPIATRQAVQWMLVDMAVSIHATRMVTYHSAWEIEQGLLDARARQMRQSMVKLMATQMVCRVVDNAIQIHGGIGYSRLMPLERMYRDVRAYRIIEGPDEMQKHVIARYLLQME